MQYDYVIPWKPRAKQRPRVARGVAYTPKETREAEAAIREQYVERAEELQLEGPLAVHIELYNDQFAIRIESHSDYQERRLRGDIDNYAKTILDALNGVAWVDDKQINYLSMEKM